MPLHYLHVITNTYKGTLCCIQISFLEGVGIYIVQMNQRNSKTMAISSVRLQTRLSVNVLLKLFFSITVYRLYVQGKQY